MNCLEEVVLRSSQNSGKSQGSESFHPHKCIRTVHDQVTTFGLSSTRLDFGRYLLQLEDGTIPYFGIPYQSMCWE